MRPLKNEQKAYHTLWRDESRMCVFYLFLKGWKRLQMEACLFHRMKAFPDGRHG